MTTMYVNLKRFDVPESLGGICPFEDGAVWARRLMEQTIEIGLNAYPEVQLVYFFPESLLIPAREAMEDIGAEKFSNLKIGSQGVHRENVRKGGNFGAFTTLLPAAAASSMGCSWVLAGHSEERKNLFDLFASYDGSVLSSAESLAQANRTIHRIANQEALRAYEAGMNVLFCMGETQEERGEGTFEHQQPKITAVLREQVELGLKDLASWTGAHSLVIAYEPRWAIGPGKIPPGPEYINFAAQTIRDAAKQYYDLDVDVVYGGGLKTENAGNIADIPSVAGGLVALTKFTPPIGFTPEELKNILDAYFRI